MSNIITRIIYSENVVKYAYTLKCFGTGVTLSNVQRVLWVYIFGKFEFVKIIVIYP